MREKLKYEHYTLDGCPPNRKSGAPPLNADMVSVAVVDNHNHRRPSHGAKMVHTGLRWSQAKVDQPKNRKKNDY